MRYKLWNIETMGYTSYIRDENNPPNTFNINNEDVDSQTRQPLIQVLYGKIRSYIYVEYYRICGVFPINIHTYAKVIYMQYRVLFKQTCMITFTNSICIYTYTYIRSYMYYW